MITQQRQTVIKKHIFLSSPISDQKNLAPCFHHSKLQVDKDCGSTFIFFSAIAVTFQRSSTMADGTVDDTVNTVTIKVTPFLKHAPETWFAHLEAQLDIKQI